MRSRAEAPSLSLVLKEGSVPYACIPGSPDLVGHDCRTTKARRIYKFLSKGPGTESRRFERSSGSSAAFHYPLIIEFSMPEGHLQICSAFDPEHGVMLDGFQMFERAPAR